MSNSTITNPPFVTIPAAASAIMLHDRIQNKLASRLPDIAASVGLGLAIVVASGVSAPAEWITRCQGCDAAVWVSGSALNDGAPGTHRLAVGKNTEQPQSNPTAEAFGFGISVDGERLVGDASFEDRQRRNDVGLEKSDIQIKFDGLGVRPLLNVSTENLRQSFTAGERIQFVATTNYPAWIARAEVRIHDSKNIPSARPLDVIDIRRPSDQVHWTMPVDGSDEYTYVLRVYDGQGRFDETVPLLLRRVTRPMPKHDTAPAQDAVSAGNGDDRTAVRNIPVYGGAITVYGREIPPGFRVTALGEDIPVDASGAFVVQRILPPGTHKIDVGVAGRRDGALKFSREVAIPENEWFYVGLADLTVGRRFGSKDLVAAAPGEFERVYTKGRLAFYLKGKVRGRYLITAAADTGEDKVENLFRNIDGKGPGELLRRIDPDKYYPVYGDDSTAIEDAPTDGKFYVKVERGNSHVMWGRFKTSIKGTEFARNERKLYGGQAVYRAETTTAHGAPVVEAEAYASKPHTLPQRDVMRGTGGSVYFLSRQDINRNSETLAIEVRDKSAVSFCAGSTSRMVRTMTSTTSRAS